MKMAFTRSKVLCSALLALFGSAAEVKGARWAAPADPSGAIAKLLGRSDPPFGVEWFFEEGMYFPSTRHHRHHTHCFTFPSLTEHRRNLPASRVEGLDSCPNTWRWLQSGGNRLAMF